MIKRYSRDKMNQIWNLESRFQAMMKVEIAVAKAQSELKIIPVKAYNCLLYTSPSPRDATLSRMPSSA